MEKNRFLIFSIFNKIISVGIFPELSQNEIKRIKLTNGSALIPGVIGLIALPIVLIMELITTGRIQVTLWPSSIGILISFLSLFSIYLNYKNRYLIARINVMVIWGMFFSVSSLLMGNELKIDQYLLGVMLLPLGIFSERRQVYISVAIVFMVYMSINISYFYITPVLKTPDSLIFYRYLIHSFSSVTVILLITLHYRWQNDSSEENLAREIEKHKKTSQELLQVNSDKDKLFSIIAHDLKGPIGSIANLLSVLDFKSIKPELMSTIQTSAQNTYELTEDLLTWASAQKDQIDIDPISFSITEQFKNIIAPLRQSAKQKNIQIKVQDENQETFVFSDMPSIKTVIRNLISNGIKFTKEGGLITVAAHTVNDKVKVTVTDTGVGIPKDKLMQLFKVGSNISSPGTQNEKGTGFGLLLCKEFVEHNGGEIGVESEPGKGSTFWFTLLPGESSQQEEVLEALQEKQLTCLVVEDNYLNLENTLKEISKLKMTYDVAKNGEEAISKGISKKYDLIFMDIDLPKFNGIDANKAIRKNYPNAVIVALSSYSEKEILQKDNSVLFNAFFRKPLHFESMIYALKNLLFDNK